MSEREVAGRARLGDDAVEEVARGMATSFPAAATLAGSDVAGRFTSHTSDFYELAPASGGEPIALLKVGGGWDSTEAQRVYNDLVDFEHLLEVSGTGIRVAPPLGWHDSPPAVCLGRIEGHDLGRLLREGDPNSTSAFVPVMQLCGEALGIFHSGMALEEGLVDEALLRGDVQKAAAAVRVTPWFLDRLDLTGATARRYGDFAPYNIRIDSGGDPWIIDQPSSQAADLVHRDVAWFLFNVERRLGWEAAKDKVGFEKARSDLVYAFHEGYARTGPVPLDSPADRSLLALYRAHRSVWTARRRLRQRKLAEVPAYLRLAMRWRAQANQRG